MKSLSHVRLFATPVDCNLPGFSIHGILQQGYWSRLPFPSPGIFPTQGLNPGLPHCRQTLYHLSHQGSPYINKLFCIYLIYAHVPLAYFHSSQIKYCWSLPERIMLFMSCYYRKVLSLAKCSPSPIFTFGEIIHVL